MVKNIGYWLSADFEKWERGKLLDDMPVDKQFEHEMNTVHLEVPIYQVLRE